MFLWIKNWLLSDRIRCTPGHSHLFRLEVGDRVLVRDRLWTVSKRTEQVVNTDVLVQFELLEEESVGQVPVLLSLTLEDDKFVRTQAHWNGDATYEELFEEDVAILKSQRR